MVYKYLLFLFLVIFSTSKSNAKWYEYSPGSSYFNVTEIGVQGNLRTFYYLDIRGYSQFWVFKVVVDCDNFDHGILAVTKYKGSTGPFSQNVKNSYELGDFYHSTDYKRKRGVNGRFPGSEIIQNIQFDNFDELVWMKHNTWLRAVTFAYKKICKF